MNALSRRRFLASTVKLGATAGILWRVTGSSLWAATRASGKPLQIAQIGCGRMGRGDMSGVMAHNLARIVAACDLDSKRLAAACESAEKFYRKRGETEVSIKAYADYREALSNPEIDAVIVSVPDHWHAQVAVAAALAGKHIYVQKPVTYNIAEAIALRTAVKARKIVLQTGSQQRSEHPFPAFRPASEAVRNGRIGQVKTVKIGVGTDKPSGKAPAAMPVPGNLDYERWLGAAPEQLYMEGRVHPQNSFDGRPGWITTEDFGLGMITNWGAHHIDIAQWGMGMELSGPTVIEATADFMRNDVWTVHHGYHIEMQYPNGVRMILDNKFENGVHFEGTEGWVFCKRGSGQVTASDPTSPPASLGKEALRASDAKILSPCLQAQHDGRRVRTTT